MVCQLIDDYRDQVAARKAEIKRLEDEVKKLEIRIDEFEILKQELKQESEQNE